MVNPNLAPCSLAPLSDEEIKDTLRSQYAHLMCESDRLERESIKLLAESREKYKHAWRLQKLYDKLYTIKEMQDEKDN